MVAAGEVLRRARHQAGLSQSEVARRAGVVQSVVSAYESGARQPSLPILQRLIEATGFQLDLRLRQQAPADQRLSGPLGQRVRRHRRRIRGIAAAHRLTNVRVFGSVARGEERPDTDIDLLVDMPAAVGLIELGRCRAELEALLEARVELVPVGDLKPAVAKTALAEAVAV